MKTCIVTKTRGFTIVELLTVMAVIAILIGLLVPALNLVKDYARELQQRNQFHSIEVGLEMFKNQFGAYPASNDNSVAPIHPVDSTPYGGAQKLAEAMVGLDFLGFHPQSDFRALGTNDVLRKDGTATIANQSLYYPAFMPNVNWQTEEENTQCRKLFLELENANAYRMQDVYGSANVGTFRTDSVVLCDVYAKKRPGQGKKTGMPILYYRARTNCMEQRYDNPPVPPLLGGIEDDIYYYRDNERLLLLGPADEASTIVHPLVDGTTDFLDFENMILNRQVLEASSMRRPYRASTYILISAGKDGLYGTADDITNFSKDETK